MFQARDFRYALRRFSREPLFTAVALLTLGLGIGATTAVYSVVDGVLLQPLPYDRPDELVSVFHSAPGLDVHRIPNSRSSHAVYETESRSFRTMALHSGTALTLTEGGEPVRLIGRRVTPALFQVLRVQPALGRAFTEEEGRPGAAPVVLLSHGLWVERFGADPDILERTVSLSDQAYEVVGVMPEGFDFPSESVRLWVPMAIDPAGTSFQGFNEEGIARLLPGVRPEDAQQEIQGLIPRLLERGGWPQTDPQPGTLLRNCGTGPVV
mgnify:FL=1